MIHADQALAGAGALPGGHVAGVGRRWFAYASISVEALREGWLFDVLDPVVLAPGGTSAPRLRSVGFIRPALWPAQFAGLADGLAVVLVSGDEGAALEDGRPVSVKVWGR